MKFNFKFILKQSPLLLFLWGMSLNQNSRKISNLKKSVKSKNIFINSKYQYFNIE